MTKAVPAGTGLSGEEIARGANRHTLAVQFWLDTRSPEAVEYQGLGMRCGSTGIEVPLLNQALGADYPAGTSDIEIAADIDGVIEFFARRGVDWYWWVSPFCQPADMDRHLAAKGIVSVTDRPLPAMVAFLDDSEWPDAPEGLRVWRAETVEDLKAASEIRRVGFKFPEGVGLNYFDAMPESWLGNGEKARLYMAGIEGGEAAAIGALIFAEGIPGIYVMATLPEYGRRGLGTAVMRQMMTEARDEGHKLAALTASRFGEGLYKKFGFKHVFNYHIYFKQNEVNE